MNNTPCKVSSDFESFLVFNLCSIEIQKVYYDKKDLFSLNGDTSLFNE